MASSPLSTFGSAEALLNHHLDNINSDGSSPQTSELLSLKKAFVLDSFKVNRFHKTYKKWENQQRNDFIQNEIASYNKQLGEVARINYETEHLQREYEKLCQQINLPDFQFSRETLEKYEGGEELLARLSEEDASSPVVSLDKIFSIQRSDGKLPKPDFEIFEALLNIEFRLRIQRRIKYEVLLIIRQQLTTKNKKWATRDSALNDFMRKLSDVTEEVEKIRKSEGEDLRGYEEDYEMEDDEDDDDEEAEEQENTEADQIDAEAGTRTEGEGETEAEGTAGPESDTETETEVGIDGDEGDAEGNSERLTGSVEPIEGESATAPGVLEERAINADDDDDDIMNVDG